MLDQKYFVLLLSLVQSYGINLKAKYHISLFVELIFKNYNQGAHELVSVV